MGLCTLKNRIGRLQIAERNERFRNRNRSIHILIPFLRRLFSQVPVVPDNDHGGKRTASARLRERRNGQLLFISLPGAARSFLSRWSRLGQRRIFARLRGFFAR